MMMSGAIDDLKLRLEPIPEGYYLLGFSGGADSVAMLMMLSASVREGRIRLEAVHVNHGLRGAESEQDAAFCAGVCRKEGIPFHAYRANLSGKTDEAAAREARFFFLRKRLTETKADALILAHHADDQAETFLMRLLRGSGPDGLEAMRPDETVQGIRILRPMLRLRRSEIRDALCADKISWREDSSNQETIYLRNRIRKELLPVMENITASAVEKICRTSWMIASDNDVLNARVKEILDQYADGWMLNAEALSQYGEALRHRALRRWWELQAPELAEHTLNAEQTDALDELLFRIKGKSNLPGGMHAVRCGKYLFLPEKKPGHPKPVQVTGKETVFGDYRLEESKSENNPGDGRRAQEVPADFISGCMIRTRQPGDRIRPFGSSGSRKLQDYMTDRKIPEPFRDGIPLLCRGNEVLLVCGVGAGNIPKWDPDNKPVRLIWHGKLPWTE